MVIGFFMPLPLAMMIPFMGIQSAVMAKQFGENFQYGKRRISAMSNDEFNKLTPALLQANANAELKAMIPSMQESITDMRQFQEFMIKEMIQTIGDLLRGGLGFLIGVPPERVNQALQDIEHFIHGHFAGEHVPTTSVPEPDITQPPPTEAPPGPTITPTEPPPTEVILEVGLTGSPRNSFAEQRFLLQNAQGMVSGSGSTWKIHSLVGGTWKLVITKPTESSAVILANQSWLVGQYLKITNQPTGETKRHFWILITKLP